MKQILSRAAGLFLLSTVLFGLLYTLAITGISQIIFPHQANGSIIEVNGKQYGSELLGQQFTQDGHLWGRVMKLDTGTYTDDAGNAVMYASPSNLTPASDEYEALIAQRVQKLRESNPEQGEQPIPVELVTGSGSGLDPEISPAAAEYQVARIAESTEYSQDEVRDIISRCTTGRFLGVFGEERVNVLRVNLALDGILEAK